ncbi:MAG TPA: hypothetical protein VNN78_01170 [Burkholderiales bacterium]|nr:hypothetical protein [Burkholderiales bacterium]
MKGICVAGQKAMNARRKAQLDAGTSSKPSNKAGALFGRNPQGRRGFRRMSLSLAAYWGVTQRRGSLRGLHTKPTPSHYSFHYVRGSKEQDDKICKKAHTDFPVSAACLNPWSKTNAY